jgi:hypothetical protein
MHDLRQRLVPSSSAAMPARTARTGGGGRILSRGGAPLFHQSDGRLAIARRHRVRALVWCTRGSDYHSLVHQSTWKIVLYMSLAYFLLTVVFAVPYYLVSADCGLEMNSFLDAMYFSLETMMTIGYGVVRNDPYFEGCATNFAVIFVQSLVSIFFDAVCLGVVYARISRVNQRATTIVFSDKAVVKFVGGLPYFCFQVCEMRKHQLIEAHVRCYAFLRKRVAGPSGGGNAATSGEQKHQQRPQRRQFMTKTMRLQHPDDELGGMLLLAVPQIVSHRIDHWSPLCPPEMSYGGSEHRFPGLIRRGVDGELGREERLSAEQQHLLHQASGGVAPTAATQSIEEMRAAITSHLQDCSLEVLVLVEGIESSQSGTVQCRHSYNVDDIEFDMTFAECVFENEEDGGIEIDFSKFHSLVNNEAGDDAFGYSASHVA